MKKYLLSLICSVAFIALAEAQGVVYPAIQGYGAVNEVPFEVEKPDPSKRYKLVVELGDPLKDKSQVADMLDYAARMYNLYIYAGIPKENIDLAVVVFSGSTPMVLSNQTHKKRFDQLNPNAGLLDELQRNGIQVIVCGQSMMKQNLLPEDIYPGVRMAVSRFTATTDLIQKGYKVIVL